MPGPDKQGGPEVGWLRLSLYLWRLTRPEFWLVTLLPFYVGYVVASRTVAPGFERWAALASGALHGGATTQQFISTLAAWLGDARPLLLGALALGPLVWGSTLVLNDYWDYHADRKNPRRSKSPLVRRLVRREDAHVWAYALGAAGLGVAVLVSWTLVILLGACLALSWAYSAPPLRLKTRPGMDVAVNAVGVGFLCALAGWTLARPITDFHWVFFVQGSLTFVGIYIPTTMVDYRYDKAEGLDTFAVRFGLRTSFRVGFVAFALSNGGALAFALADFVIPRAFLPVLVPFEIVLLLQYYLLIGDYRRQKSIVKGVALSAFTMLFVNVLFVLAYTGLWRI